MDNAFEKARAAYGTGTYDDTTLEFLFPQLKESEDERIKKIITDSVFYQYGEGVEYKDVLDYLDNLEKQKDAITDVTMTEAYKMGLEAGRAQEEAEKFFDSAQSYHDGFIAGQKQKENPKSCDSISADCVSDAKCEDRWHKVGDSLPYNPREVLCKDEAGNYFIGRYYVGEGWEISNYDDEDKPHHLNPPVSKWIDFPLELQKEPENTSASTMIPSCWEVEQKEQKPAEINVKALLAADRLASAEMTGRLKERSEILENPEEYGLQKPAEWSEEDEKIRDRIIDILNRTFSVYSALGTSSTRPSCPTYKDEIDWLKSLRTSWRPSEEKYDGNMDKECIKLCDILNTIPSIDTFESCCGHLKDRYSIWFFCNDIITISRLGKCVERNNSDGKWELLVDSTDTHPTGVFWLRSKVPFQSYDEMEKSVNGLCDHIPYWFNTKFDSYFNCNVCEETTKKEEHWKPSEEQMNALKEAYESYDFCDGERNALESLHENLKKL